MLVKGLEQVNSVVSVGLVSAPEASHVLIRLGLLSSL